MKPLCVTVSFRLTGYRKSGLGEQRQNEKDGKAKRQRKTACNEGRGCRQQVRHQSDYVSVHGAIRQASRVS